MPLLLKSLGVSDFWLGPTLSLSQATEALSLAILPLLLFRFGIRGTMLFGLGAWTVSFICLALGSPRELMIGSIGLGGLCITGFMVAGQVFVHRAAGSEVRTSVQGLLTFVSGAGLFVGNVSVGLVRHTLGEELPRAFSVAALVSAGMVLLFVFGFRQRKVSATDMADDLTPVLVDQPANCCNSAINSSIACASASSAATRLSFSAEPARRSTTAARSDTPVLK